MRIKLEKAESKEYLLEEIKEDNERLNMFRKNIYRHIVPLDEDEFENTLDEIIYVARQQGRNLYPLETFGILSVTAALRKRQGAKKKELGRAD